MGKIAVCVFGVNGVGKTSVLRAVSGVQFGATIIRGSSVLKDTLGLTSYKALELMSPSTKKYALMQGLRTSIRSGSSPITFVDTHLVVPVRRSGQLTLEDMWDDELLGLFDAFVYITAHPRLVSERRRYDLSRQLRVQNSSLQTCIEDLALNAEAWKRVCGRMTNKAVIVNDGMIPSTVLKIVYFLEYVRSVSSNHMADTLTL